MSNVKMATPPAYVGAVPLSQDQIGDFQFDGEKVESRFVVSFMFKGTATELMELISAQGALHIASEDIKGMTIREKGRVQFRNRRFRSK